MASRSSGPGTSHSGARHAVVVGGGPLGAGVTTKLVNNLVSTAICAITGEAMAVGVAAGLEPEAIAYPVRAIFRDYPNVDFRLAEARGAPLDEDDLFGPDYLLRRVAS